MYQINYTHSKIDFSPYFYTSIITLYQIDFQQRNDILKSYPYMHLIH